MIVIMGMPGAGKSTVLGGIKNSAYKRLNYGDLMFEIAQKKFGLGHRDEMRRLDIAKQKEVQHLVADALSKETGKVILDTHCSISTAKGYLPGLPFSLLSKIRVDGLVLITAPPEDIMRRRKSDTTRVRDADSLELLREHEGINRAFLAAYAAYTGAPALIVTNRDNGLEAAVAKMEAILV
jgi:adenylate kinase